MKLSEAQRALDCADDLPFDAPDGCPIGEATASKDWAHRAARAIIIDLCDRSGIKHGFGGIDHEMRVEIVSTMAEIIRRAALKGSEK